MLVVDAANVVGSRPTGWSRDRAGAARTFVARVAAAAARHGLDPPIVVVLDGAARAGVPAGTVGPGVEVVHATGSGDDAIVAIVDSMGPAPVRVVSADRGLRARIARPTVEVLGPRWLLDRLDAAYARDVEGGFVLVPVGVVRSTRSVAEDDDWDAETSVIELLPPFDERALRGLDEFSHCIVVYLFDRAEWNEDRMVRRPRGNPDWPEVGIFAQRAKDRPNRLGVTTCRVLRVDGAVLHVADLDAIDGTPVVDIKPHMREFGPRGDEHQPSWADELMQGYW